MIIDELKNKRFRRKTKKDLSKKFGDKYFYHFIFNKNN